jgi:hypothetical protein
MLLPLNFVFNIDIPLRKRKKCLDTPFATTVETRTGSQKAHFRHAPRAFQRLCRASGKPMMKTMPAAGTAAFQSDILSDAAGDLTRIGEMARQFGVTLRTLRFYEDKGLISPLREGATRLYSRRDKARLKLILLVR